VQSEVLKDVPARLLSQLAEGQQLQATVVARLNASVVQLRLGDTLIQLSTEQALQPGQKVLLERSVENGQPLIKLTPAATEQPLSAPALRLGQQVAVEVIKLLAGNRLLVSPSLINTTDSKPQTATQNRLPTQIEVDISALKQAFRPGDKLTLEVLKEQPLAVQLKIASPSRAELIQNYQRQTLAQLNATGSNTLSMLSQLKPELFSTETIRQSISQLMQGMTDRQSLQQADGLRQALNNSGLFLEKRLLQDNPQTFVRQDLKANLLQLAQQLKTEVAQPPSRLADNQPLQNSLPKQVQTALQQLSQPQALRALPALIQPALASQGQTPGQLLLSLLSALTANTGLATEPQTVPASVMTSVQAFIQAREVMANDAASQTALRALEWQVLRELLREVESVSARIQLNQLTMLRDTDNPSNVNIWLFDLPVKDKQQLERLQLRLEQHSPSLLTEDDETIWQVQLNLETQNLGPMQARISLHNDDVKVVLLAEREEGAALLVNHIEALNQRLTKLGMNVSHLSCRQAPVHPLQAEAAVLLSDHLLDISV
jgi:translation initiation factor 2B subunit (eIF-2B alpha/beta/delta family)